MTQIYTGLGPWSPPARRIRTWPNPTRLRRRPPPIPSSGRPWRSSGSSPRPPPTPSSSPTSTRGSRSGTRAAEQLYGIPAADAARAGHLPPDRGHDRGRGRRPELAAPGDRAGHRRLARPGHRAAKRRPRGRPGGRRRDGAQPAGRRAGPGPRGPEHQARHHRLLPARARARRARQPRDGHRRRPNPGGDRPVRDRRPVRGDLGQLRADHRRGRRGGQAGGGARPRSGGRPPGGRADPDRRAAARGRRAVGPGRGRRP